MEQEILRESLLVTTRQVTDEDKALAHEFNLLARAVLARAHKAVLYGPPPERQLVMRSVLTAVAKLSSVDAKAEVEASRVQFLDALSQMTEIDAEATPVPLDLAALDQDDEARHPEVRP